jgi:hypothetical protein
MHRPINEPPSLPARSRTMARRDNSPSPLLIPIPAWVLLKIISRIPFSEAHEILLTVRGAKSFCCDGQLATTRFWIGGCTMHKHDFVADGFLAVTAASLVLLCSGLLAIAFG